MNPSTAQARVLVDELIRNGVRHAVLCPGSRNAPLSFALHAASLAGRINLHVRIDERGAGFLALGLALGTRTPVVVSCTSGTAVANLHPAMLEAVHSKVPLIALTADRPVELHRAGASQTVDQHGILGVETLHIPIAEQREGQHPMWRSLICRAIGRRGPVHVNVPFREPLVPDDDSSWPDDGREAWTRTETASKVSYGPAGHLSSRTVVVIGEDHPERASAAQHLGWPVIAAPTAGRNCLKHGTLLVNAGLPEHLEPEAVVVVGRATLSRGISRLLARTPTVHVVGDEDWPDPQFNATHATPWLPRPETVDHAWTEEWRATDKAVAVAVDELLAEEPWPTGLHVARELVEAIGEDAPLFVGSSNPVRDIDLVATPRDHVFANRGVAGIDGSVSTAVGLALASGPAYALLGDLTFLHDLNGLLIGPDEERPDLTIVVLNDDGGGIFSLLEQGSPEHELSFERVFGTPHHADLAALCAGYRIPHSLVDSAEQFRAALAIPRGIHVVEVRAQRAGLRDLHERLKSTVSTLLAR
ncbi:2-succinyl-5-enolpyruvyl-6-hydroxy-3-cyclohexene-1-carboxylate synthase [Lentzea sp. NBRC 105346]|uniref:2-succinyl-5-enolpyruvyl-6-hydroxy-3- cyclohexene-1-carboxylic-acid synthase n=1 Tax=Lentzea sp. NBRC 105346 TaxID=3032205 RepID=UPI0025560196|nr:2-succinyl-5-enolpyruvyl-6-hydroxy-3-cyclohexene-1-carboxylic-acid synthase [Lentzea sp. NBRC 105346]GLZ30628.1 2-succinyl-5-enolpyruvyl-6-hydroxy-3-cyclohexene-1-carboxylate synthase [Lentzea sp. NBRC 105346]